MIHNHPHDLGKVIRVIVLRNKEGGELGQAASV